MKKFRIEWIYRAAAALLVLVLLTSHLSGRMMARYRVTGSGGDGARVAKFEVVRTSEDLLVKGIRVWMDPTTGTRKCADLSIVNHSEVAIRCVPQLKTTENLPLTYFWATDENGTEKVTQVEIAPNDSTEVKLYLFAVWPSEAAAKSHTYHREIDQVDVTIACEQID